MANSLQYWYNNGNISWGEKDRLNKIGVSDYDYRNLHEFKKILECEEVAKRKSILSYQGQVNWIGFFSTWFNNNCATVIQGNPGNYSLSIVVHEPVQHEMLERVWYKTKNTGYSLENLRNEAYDLENYLKHRENPIVYVHDEEIDAFAHAYRGISLTELPTVISEVLTCNHYSYFNPDFHLKPFDIVKTPGATSGSSVSHSAIYLGNSTIAHVPGSNKGAKVENWSDFLGSNHYTSVELYHPMIPYKRQDGENGIINHIARAVASDEYDDSYRLTGLWQGINRTHGNCQHFANRCVFGLNFSESGTKFKKKIPLNEEIGDTDREFRNLTIRDVNQGYYQSKKNQIENAVNSWRNNYQGQQFESRIEVRPNPPCRIQ